MNKVANLVAYRYSKHPPEFYRFKGASAPRGIGCGPIAEDAGLWNLAWLSIDKNYISYEQFREDDHLPMWTGSGLEIFAELGAVVVNGDKLSVWAAKLPAKKLMKMFAAFPPAAKHPFKGVTWVAWLAFANYRANSSVDAVVDPAEFDPAKSYETLVEEARQAEVIVRAQPKPGLPIFPKARRSKKKSAEAWLAKWKRDASSQGANSNV